MTGTATKPELKQTRARSVRAAGYEFGHMAPHGTCTTVTPQAEKEEYARNATRKDLPDLVEDSDRLTIIVIVG